MKRSLLVLMFLVTSILSAQGNDISFSQALNVHLPRYIQDVEKAIVHREKDTIAHLFNHLVESKLVGTHFDDFQSNSLGKKNIPFSKFEKPVLLITYSAWSIPSKGELPALNELAKEYGDQIDIVLLFWSDQKTARKIAKKYHHRIKIRYVDDQDNKNTQIIRNLKHSLGLPLIFSISSEEEVINIEKRIVNKLHETVENSYLQNMELYQNSIQKLLPNELLSSVTIGVK
jgi:thiol-disulfide isomerase/thioredoxin